MRWTFVIPVSTCPSRSVARNDNSFVPRVLKGHGFSRAVTCARRVGLQPLGKLALRLNTEVPHWLEHFHTWYIGWSTASAVQLGFGNEAALDSLSKVKVNIKVKSCWGRGIKAFPCHRCHAATLVGTASDEQTRAPSNSASCLNMPKTACSSLRMTATSATILHLPRSCRAPVSYTHLTLPTKRIV